MRPFKAGAVPEKEFDIEIIRLSNKVHEYEFAVNDALLAHFENDSIQHAEVKAAVSLDKSERMMEAKFRLTGTVQLVCDRSLEVFDYPIQWEEVIVYKFGEADEDVSEALQIISWDKERINVMQPIYDMLNMAVPMKKLHPKFADESDEDEVIFSTEPEEEEKAINEDDPRWAALKKLKNEE